MRRIDRARAFHDKPFPMAIWDRDYMRDRPAERAAPQRRAGRSGAGGVWLFIAAMVATGVALNWEQVRSAAQRVAAGSSPLAAPEAEPASNWININRASAKELRTLPGISPEVAAAIVAGRPYQTVDDLRRVKGINPARLEIIRALITVDSSP